eukprot:3615061-Amphidinium_carterae.1
MRSRYQQHVDASFVQGVLAVVVTNRGGCSAECHVVRSTLVASVSCRTFVREPRGEWQNT